MGLPEVYLLSACTLLALGRLGSGGDQQPYIWSESCPNAHNGATH